MYSFYGDMFNKEATLVHYGVKGMKWGKHKSLTEYLNDRNPNAPKQKQKELDPTFKGRSPASVMFDEIKDAYNSEKGQEIVNKIKGIKDFYVRVYSGAVDNRVKRKYGYSGLDAKNKIQDYTKDIANKIINR